MRTSARKSMEILVSAALTSGHPVHVGVPFFQNIRSGKRFISVTASADDILPNADEENFGLRDGIIPNFSLRQALDIGESFLNNVTTDVKRNTRKVQPATATSFHSVLQKARPGAEELNRVGIIAMEASRNLEEPGLRLCVSSSM